MFFFGTVLWLLSIREAPSITASGNNKMGIWLMIIVFAALAVWYFLCTALLLIEVQRISIVDDRILLLYWFLGQRTFSISARLLVSYQGRVLRFGEAERALERVRVVYAGSLRIFSFAPSALDEGVVFTNSGFSR